MVILQVLKVLSGTYPQDIIIKTDVRNQYNETVGAGISKINLEDSSNEQ
jgi:hypothetical protein